MTRLRLAPRSLWGPLGPLPSSPLSLLQVFSLSSALSLPFHVRLVLFFVYLFFSSFLVCLTVSACRGLKLTLILSTGHQRCVSSCCFVSLNANKKHCKDL